MRALPPIPLLVSDRGTPLYALPVVDARYLWRSACTQDFNVSRFNRSKVVTETADGADDPYTSNEIVADLISTLGITLAVGPSITENHPPVDVLAKGRLASETLDQVLANGGKMFVAHTDGTFSALALGDTTCASLIDTHKNALLHGSALYGTSADAFVSAHLPNVFWQGSAAPASVDVVFPLVSAAIPYLTQVDIRNVATPGTLNVRSGWKHTIHASGYGHKFTSGTLNATELGERAEDAAYAYLDRFVAGAMDAVFAGVFDVSTGGAADIEWIIDGVHGSMTRLHSGLHDPIRGWKHGPDSARAGLGVSAFPTPFGSVVTTHPGVFPISLTQTGGSQGTASAAASWTYTVTETASALQLGTSVNPVNAPHLWRRPSLGQMVAATAGLAHYNESGAFIIDWINEVPGPGACE
jgi:hypothetical protein